MYPRTFFSLFPTFPRDNKVFVAMSFAPVFQARWEHAIAPGIAAVRRGGSPLEAVRVDTRTVSDSILTEILTGISTSQLVFADVTQLGQLDGTPIRNANVMYEVGIAHAVRLPEEVLLFRSDDEPLLFDLANVRVNRYDPDGQPAAAKDVVTRSVIAALRELDVSKHLAVTRAAEELDHTSVTILSETLGVDGLPHPITRTMRDALSNARRERAIERLLAMGAIRARFTKLSAKLLDGARAPNDEFLRYDATEFGKALIQHVAAEMNFFDPEIQRRMEGEAPKSGQE